MREVDVFRSLHFVHLIYLMLNQSILSVLLIFSGCFQGSTFLKENFLFLFSTCRHLLCASSNNRLAESVNWVVST